MANELDNFGIFRKSGLERQPIGTVVGGSLSKGVDVKLTFDDVERGVQAGSIIEDMAVGKYVVIEGASGKKFFSIVTDIALDSNNPDLAKAPPDADDSFTANVYGSSIAFGRLQVAPMLLLEGDDEQAKPRPVKTIPAHFANVFEATEEDVNKVFGEEGRDKTTGDFRWHIGAPLDMGDEVKVNLNLNRFVERSSGVFGKSGTGKSFITRILLSGIVKADVASCLIFDMHNDYGWSVFNERGREYKGLRQLFPDRVEVLTLDPETSRNRNSKIEGELSIGLDQIEPKDVENLRQILKLTDVQVNAIHYLGRRLGRDWIAQLIGDQGSEELEKIEAEGKFHPGTIQSIKGKFEFFRRFGFLHRPSQDMVAYIFDAISRGKSIVLEFGRYGNELAAYLLVANYLTRRIHERYVDAKDKSAGRIADEPRKLTVVIEEAHKFLGQEIAQDTIFGTIARELRKYNVTLLIVDQRPSGIDEEVMSQIGTRVTCLLDNEADIRAVFSGVSGAGQLREVLARLDTQQQALILGHAVPMPVVVKTRDYDEALYAAVGYGDEAARKEQRKKEKKALYGEEE